MTETLSEELRAVIRTYPVKITAHYKSLIREKTIQSGGSACRQRRNWTRFRMLCPTTGSEKFRRARART